MIRLLYARALDDGSTAIVIDYDGKFLGGVAHLMSFKHCIHMGTRWLAETDFHFHWEWYELVDSPEDFAERKPWQKRISSQKLIGHD